MTEIVEVKDFIPAYTDAVQKLLKLRDMMNN